MQEGMAAYRASVFEAGRQTYVALARALNTHPIPTTIRTDDLLSPFDGKPLSYKYNGKEIVIQVSGKPGPGGKSPVLKIPPDPPKL